MIELIQFPWSPFCIVQRRILEFSGTPFKITNIPNQDRSLVWKLTKHRYYGVPVIRDGKFVVFELNEDTQVIAKYLDQKLRLGLFPFELEGVQSILWRNIENEIEGATFRLDDIYWKELVPPAEQLRFPAAQGTKIWPWLSRPVARAAGGLAEKAGARPAAVRGNAGAQFISARRGTAFRGFRPVRDAGEFPLFWPLRIARRASAHQGMAFADGRIENPEGEMIFNRIFAQAGLPKPLQQLFLLH